MTSKKKILKKDIKYDCELCGLYKDCESPKMKGLGCFEKGIMVIGEAPGEKEDIKGVPFIGRSGSLLRKALDELGYDLDEDFYVTNERYRKIKDLTILRDSQLCFITRSSPNKTELS